MPWADGYEVVRRLRSGGGRGVRIVGVSAHAAGVEREKALAAGMEAFLVKPVVLAELAAAVAGRAAVRPAARWPGDTALQAKLENQFRAELPQLLAELAAARPPRTLNASACARTTSRTAPTCSNTAPCR